MNRFDVIVVGAGPAGLAAAAAASGAGSRVLLLDAGARAGGQFWRHRGEPPRAAQSLFAQLKRVEYRPETPVWLVQQGFTVNGSYQAERLILATGAYDRVIPFQGWDLPGVMTAGGAQAMLKGQGVLAGRRIVVAGAGPFLLPVATGLAAAGAQIAGVFESGNPQRYLRHPGAWSKAGEALGYGLRLLRRRIPYRTGHRVVAAHGEDRLRSVSVAGPRGVRELACDTLAIGYGFTPQVELAVALGCRTTLDSDGSLVVWTRQPGVATSVPGVYAAGEVTGVGGAALAVVEGELAGLAAAGVTAPGRLLRRRESLRRFASLMASIHAVPAVDCGDEVIVCRCENVTAAALRGAVAGLGVVDTRGAKLMTRTGMGWCQGRVCGHAAAHLTAQALGRRVSAVDLETFANRPLAQPVTLSDMAVLKDER